MFSHIMLGASDIEASRKFYDATLGALGYGPGVMDPKGRVFYITDSGIFGSQHPSMATLPPRPTVAPLDSHRRVLKPLRPGMKPAWPMVEQIVRTHPVFAMEIWDRSTSLISEIPLATRSARCLECNHAAAGCTSVALGGTRACGTHLAWPKL